jgi:hypothetical protein
MISDFPIAPPIRVKDSPRERRLETLEHALLPIEPEQLLVVDDVAFPLEQNMQAPITEAAAFTGDRRHALAKAGIVRPGRLVSDGHAAAADGFTRPPFAHPVGIHEMRDSFPLGRGRHHFFPKRSFNAALSSMASASNHFSRVFLSSSGFLHHR